MSRPKVNAVIEMPTSDNEIDTLNQQSAQVHSSELEIIVRDFGNGIPYSKAVYQDKIVRHLQRSAEELFEAGKALYVAYKYTEHGDWMNYLSEIGLEHSVAARMIRAAKKFNKPDLKPVITAAGNKSKLIELMCLDDDDLVKVAQGAEDAPITLDEIDRMPASELRKALREARADSEATKKVLADKNTKIDKLETQLEKTKSADKPERPTPNYDVLALQTELTEKKFEFELAIKRIESVLENLRECDENYLKTAKETAQSMQSSYMNMAANLGISLLDDDAWLKDIDVDDIVDE